MTLSLPKKSDLGVRTVSAAAMLAVAGTALWLGGWWWTVFVAVVVLAVLWEWQGLVNGFAASPLSRAFWYAAGIVYICVAGFELALLRNLIGDMSLLLALAGAVIATDTGAYFAGRTIGGPKIAPRISPSKTWAGLFGGIIASAIVVTLAAYFTHQFTCSAAGGFTDRSGEPASGNFLVFAFAGAVIAVLAQAGDFFESWMKRRAGKKDSGSLIPGHGGLLDRVDGLLAVMFVMGVISIGDLLQ